MRTNERQQAKAYSHCVNPNLSPWYYALVLHLINTTSNPVFYGLTFEQFRVETLGLVLYQERVIQRTS